MSDGRECIREALRKVNFGSKIHKEERHDSPATELLLSAEEVALLEESQRTGKAIKIGPTIEFSIVDGKLVAKRI